MPSHYGNGNGNGNNRGNHHSQQYRIIGEGTLYSGMVLHIGDKIYSTHSGAMEATSRELEGVHTPLPRNTQRGARHMSVSPNARNTGMSVRRNYTTPRNNTNTRNNLIARPGQFVNERTGQPYAGPYHMHDGQAMIGAQHSSVPHDNLRRTNRSNMNPTTSRMARQPMRRQTTRRNGTSNTRMNNRTTRQGSMRTMSRTNTRMNRNMNTNGNGRRTMRASRNRTTMRRSSGGGGGGY